MIIWSGWGFMVAVVVFIASLVTELAVEAYFRNDTYYQTEAWPLAMALVIAGCISWFWGSSLNRKPGRTVIDKETGREEVLNGTAHHRLFFVPMQYWGPILAAGAVIVSLARSSAR